MIELFPVQVDGWCLNGASRAERKAYEQQKAVTRHNIDNAKNLACWECKYFGAHGCRRLTHDKR